MRKFVDPPAKTLAEFCRERGIRWMAVFGSALGSDFGRESDIDLLVEFEPGRAPGLISLQGYAAELDELFGGDVDLRTPRDLSRYFRSRVVANARTLYGSR